MGINLNYKHLKSRNYLVACKNEWVQTKNEEIVPSLERLDITSLSDHAAVQNISVYYTWKSIRKGYKNNKIKIIVSTLNDEFELPNGSYSASHTQDCIECIIKGHKKLPNNSSIHIYIDRINNILMSKIKDEYKPELQTPETMKLFASIKK